MVNKEKKLIVLMPPKTASNSLKKSFRESGNPFTKFSLSYKKPKIHLYLSELVKVFAIRNLAEYKIIQIVRNPYQRYVSSYFHQMKSVNKSEENIPFKNYDINQFTKWLSDCLVESEKEKNFNEIFYGQNNFLKKSKRRGTWGGSRLYKNQSEWNDMPITKTKFFKLEDISNDITELNEYLGFKINPLETVNENKKENDYEKYLSSEIIEFVKKRFEIDFKLLDYGLEYKSDSSRG